MISSNYYTWFIILQQNLYRMWKFPNCQKENIQKLSSLMNLFNFVKNSNTLSVIKWNKQRSIMKHEIIQRNICSLRSLWRYILLYTFIRHGRGGENIAVNEISRKARTMPLTWWKYKLTANLKDFFFWVLLDNHAISSLRCFHVLYFIKYFIICKIFYNFNF